jgi:hypothetical protein
MEQKLFCHCGEKAVDLHNGLCYDHIPTGDRYWSDEEADKRWFSQPGYKILELSGIRMSEADKNAARRLSRMI